MFYLSTTDIRIAAAKQAGNLNITYHVGRNGGYFAVCGGDDLIAVTSTKEEAIGMCCGRYQVAERLC